MTTIGALVDRTINRWLMGTYRARYNALAVPVDANDTDLDLLYDLDQVGKGSFLAIDDELVFVLGSNASAKRVTCVRGMRGTTATAHDNQAPVEVNPRYPRALVREAMAEDIRAWPDTVYFVDVREVVIPLRSAAIDVQSALNVATSDVVGIVDVKRSGRCVDEGRWVSVPFTFAPDAGVVGATFVYLDWPVRDANESYRLTIARRFGVDEGFVDATDLADLHIPERYADICCLGAAWRLVTGKETRRLDVDAAGESRLATEVHERELARFGEQLRGLRSTRLAEEAKRLVARYGIHGN